MFLKIVETKGFYGASLPSSILIVNIVKQNKKFADIIEKIENFPNLMETVFEILIIYKPSLRTCEVPHKSWAR